MKNLYDVIIIGGGPAGLTAALYLSRARYRVLLLEKESFGGQIKITSEVVNYPGIKKIDGHTLIENMQKQAESFGAEFLIAEAISLDIENDIKIVKTNKGDFNCFGILIATGAYPKKIGFKGEEEYQGHGVAYCATCDGEFFTDKEVFVVGSGYTAAEESVFLTKYAKNIKILIRGDKFKCDELTASHAINHPKIEVLYNTELLEVSGDDFLTNLKYKNIKTNEITEYNTKENFGVFVFAGYVPQIDIIKDKVELTKDGYIKTDKNQKTTKDGIYAAGDVCEKSLRQVVTATGDGAIAATELEKYVSLLQQKTGIKPKLKEVNKDNIKNKTINEDCIFSCEIKEQLNTVFSKMENKLVLELCLDDRKVSLELEKYIKEMLKLTDKLELKYRNDNETKKPVVRIFDKTNKYTNVAFYGVPGGHEFTSFILGLYNISGPGQYIEEKLKSRVEKIDKEVNIKILISLSCTMCPDLVVASWKIASLNKKISVETFDINHFEDLKNKYKVMSVPCMVINNEKIFFGKKNIEQILDIIENN